MNSLIQANIFFFISSVSIVLIALSIVLIGIYVFSILRTVKRIIKKIDLEIDAASKSIDTIRNNIEHTSSTDVLNFIGTAIAWFRRRKK